MSQSEVNIETKFRIWGTNNASFWGKIRNNSEGGLRFGSEFHLIDNIRVEGRGATHIAGPISWTGSSSTSRIIETYSEDFGMRPHLVLSGNNSNWSGELRVGQQTLVIVKADGALGTGANNVSGGSADFEGNSWTSGTLAFRSHLAPATQNGTGISTGLNYTATAQAITIGGLGTTRRDEVGPTGALYNDGGYNLYSKDITISGFLTGIGSRGDRQGGLMLNGALTGSSQNLLKLGLGLVSLGQTATTGFTATSLIGSGVLRFANTSPATQLIQFRSDTGASYGFPNSDDLFAAPNAGGFFESRGTFTRSLSGQGSVAWFGNGGFSAYGGDLNVSLGGTQSPLQLTWGQGGFVPVSSALLLSSRYATHRTTFANAISLNGAVREIYVERGVSANAYGVISGQLIDILKTGGIHKRGRGLLHLSNTANSNQAPTLISEGALMGFGITANSSSGISHYSNIHLNGGVLMLPSSTGNTNLFYAPTIGMGAGQVRWGTDGGGFAVWSSTTGAPGARFLLLNGDPNTRLYWQFGSELRFGHYTANGTLFWNNNLSLKTDSNQLDHSPKTIRLERSRQPGPELVFMGLDIEAPGNLGGTLSIVGDGHMAIASALRNLLTPRLNIYGAELRLFTANGRIHARAPGSYFDLGYGGHLVLDSRYGFTPGDTTGGGQNSARLNTNTDIRFNAGRFTLRAAAGQSLIEQIGRLDLASGANEISIQGFGDAPQAQIHAHSLLRSEMKHRSTLVVIGSLNAIERLRLTNSADDTQLVNDFKEGDRIFPWATTGENWLTQTKSGNAYYLTALSSYHTGNEGTWHLSNNVSLTSGNTVTFSNNRAINSLRLGHGSTLDLRAFTLAIHSGGLRALSTATITDDRNKGTLVTAISPKSRRMRPLYIHVEKRLSFTGSAAIGESRTPFDVVKTHPGELLLGSDATHFIESLYIHQGTVTLERGNLNVLGRIYIGDGAGTDILRLAANRWDQINPSVNITLHGTPYDPRGPEYGGAQAILQLGGNSKQHIANLHIESRGTIDWVGGEVGKANILWIDNLTMSSKGDSAPDYRLFLRNWYEYEDILLVRKTSNILSVIRSIVFEGYEDHITIHRDWDSNYWQITPFNNTPVPESATYGAILAATGLAATIYRHQRKSRRQAR